MQLRDRRRFGAAGDRAPRGSFTRRPAVIAAMVAVAASVGLAACGSSSPSSAGSQASAASDIVIGLANNESSTGLDIPAYRYGALAAVNYINAAGGINGHRLKADVCIDDGSPEGSVNCANNFVAAHAVVYFAGADTGADAALPILSGDHIPYVTEIPWSALQGTSPDAFALTTGTTTFDVAGIAQVKALGEKSAAFIGYDIPSVQTQLPYLKGLAAKQGIKLTIILVPVTNPDWTSVVATAEADHVKALWAILQEADCTSMVLAARTSGFTGPIDMGACSAYINAVGNKAAGTYSVWPDYFPDLAAAAPASIRAQINIYDKYMKAAGYGSDLNGYATIAFSAMVELSEIMKELPGTVTGAPLLAALKTASVPGFMSSGIHCGAHLIPTQPAACSANLLLLKVVATAHGPARELQQPGYYDTAAG